MAGIALSLHTLAGTSWLVLVLSLHTPAGTSWLELSLSLEYCTPVPDLGALPDTASL